MKTRAIMKLPKYFVVQDPEAVKLNQNESPFDIPPLLKSRIMKRLAKAKWNRYPAQEPAGLIQAIARYARVRRENVVIGNSSNEIIQALIQASCVKGDRLVTVSPGFAIYSRIGRIMGLDVCEIELEERFGFNAEKIAGAAKNAQLVMVASPNSPTGTVLKLGDIDFLLRNTNCLVAIDEAYHEFYGRTALKYLRAHANLVVIRTFSKAFSLAGARLGYLIARPGIAEAVANVRLPFTVGWFAQTAGEEVLNRRAYAKSFASRIIKERRRVFSELVKHACIKPVPSETNFILFEIKGRKARDVFDGLYRKGVLVRPFDTRRLKNFLRVTIGDRKENDIFLITLKAVMEET